MASSSAVPAVRFSPNYGIMLKKKSQVLSVESDLGSDSQPQQIPHGHLLNLENKNSDLNLMQCD